MTLMNDLVLIEEIKTPTETKINGLIIPNASKEKEYEVKQLGIKCKALNVGDKIHLHEHTSLLPFNDGFLFNEAIGIKAIL